MLRRKPWAPLVWSVVYVGATGVTVGLLGAAFIKALGRLATLSPTSHVKLEELLGLLAGVAAGYFLLIAVFWVVGAIINMAVVRAVHGAGARHVRLHARSARPSCG